MSNARKLAERDVSVTPNVTIDPVDLAEPIVTSVLNEADFGDYGVVTGLAYDVNGDAIESSYTETPYTPTSRYTELAPTIAITGASTIKLVNEDAFLPKSPPVILDITQTSNWTTYSHRYLRITEFVLLNPSDNNGQISLSQIEFYTGTNGTGTLLPNGTATASYTRDATYPPSKAVDESYLTMWWGLGSTNTDEYRLAMWIDINRGASPATVNSTRLVLNPSYAIYHAKMYGSDTGAFAGEETFLKAFTTNRSTAIVGDETKNELLF